MGKYRNKLQIIADILSIVRRGAKKTHVMYQANLSYTLLTRYLTKTLDAGLVNVDNDYYTLTTWGESFLDRFDEYSKRCGQLEKQLNNVNNEKVLLESMVKGNFNSDAKWQNRKLK